MMIIIMIMSIQQLWSRTASNGVLKIDSILCFFCDNNKPYLIEDCRLI